METPLKKEAGLNVKDLFWVYGLQAVGRDW